MAETVHCHLVPLSQPGWAGRGPLGRRIGDLVASPGFTKLWRYGAVSAISTVVTLGSLYVFYRVLPLGSAAAANVAATAVATVPAYYLNRTWVWAKRGRSHLWREIVPFWVIAGLGLAFSTGAVELASSEAHRLSRAHDVQTALVEAANLSTYGLLWVGKFFLFNHLVFKGDHRAPTRDEASPVPRPLELP